MRAAVKASVPAGTEELNVKAFEAGCAYSDQEYGTGKLSAASSPSSAAAV
jgi:Pyruvate/2-oxoacid:ferredoxin oxidoreductase gamma subunit